MFLETEKCDESGGIPLVIFALRIMYGEVADAATVSCLALLA